MAGFQPRVEVFEHGLGQRAEAHVGHPLAHLDVAGGDSALAAQLEGGHLLTRVGEGHGSYVSGNRCIDETVTAHLLEGVLPAEERIC